MPVVRHKNSISQVNLERDKELRRLFCRAQDIAGYPATLDRIFTITACLPASKFYISDYWASRYIRNRLRGNVKRFRNGYKQTLYNALFSEFLQLSRRSENREKSFDTLVDMALERPAPVIGLSPHSLGDIVRYRLNIRQYQSRKKDNPQIK